MNMKTGVFAQTNDAAANELVAFARTDTGELTALGRFATGGRGTGTPHLPSQGSLAVDPERGLLLVTNGGSDDVTLFALAAEEPKLVARIPSGGSRPVSATIRGGIAYVVNAGDATISGFTVSAMGIELIDGSTRSIGDGVDPAQIALSPDGRNLVVTDRAHDAIVVFTVASNGLAGMPSSHPSAGVTPYGFDWSGDTLVVTEAFGGRAGEAAASSYRLSGGMLEPISSSIGTMRSEVCWAVASPDGRHVWVTNFGDGTISAYALGMDGALNVVRAIAGTTVQGMKGLRDVARSADGRFLYALDADAQRVFGFRVVDGGGLEPVTEVDGLPETVAGLAAL